MYKQFYSKLLLLVAMIVAGAGTVSAADKWVKTAPANLQTGDIVVIADQTSGKAMSNTGGTSSAPSAVTVDFNTDKSELVETYNTIATSIQWTVNVSNSGLAFYADETNFLYCISNNNGVRVGDSNDNHFFEIKEHTNGVGYLFNKGQSRYLGVYSNQDWRCYTSVNSNINTCVTAFYKKVTDQSGLTPIGTIGDLTPTTVNIETEGTFELPITFASNDPTDYEVTWESNNTDVLDVDNDGNYQAYTAGEVTITVNIEPVDDQTYEAVSKEFTVTVIDPADIITYEKVTNANQLVAGNEYILVAEDSNVAMGAQNNKLRTPVDVAISNNKVAIQDEAVAVLTLGGVSGAWTFQASDNDKYLALTANSNEVHASDDATLATSKWTITDDFQLEMTAQTDARYLRYNSGSPRFACYKSGQVEAYLYVKQGSSTNTKAAADLSFAETSYEANLGEAFTAPELTNPNQLEVTYASSNTDVATVNETSGEVNIVAAGQTTITATFSGNDEYEAGTASYTLTVVDPNAPGTANNPYTVEAAIAYINTLGTSSSPTEVYVKGIVSQVDSYNDKYKSITYWISDDGETTTQMEVYSGKGLNSADFASKDDIQVGDEVTVCGTVKLYKQTPEFDYNNYLVSLVRPQASQDPVITAENVNIAYDATEGTISYTLNNPVDNGKLTATTNANWLTLGTVGETIPFTTTANDAAAEREAIVTLTYSYDNKTATKEVKVTQAGNPNIVMTIAEVRAQATGDVVTKGVVTSCVGKTAYIQDETAAICVYGSSNLELNKGEEVKVSGSLSTYNGLLEITSPTCEVLSSDNNVTATVKTIEEINNDYAEGNTLQGLLVKIENATVTVINGQNTTIAQGENTIVVRGISSDVQYAVDDVLTLTGNIGCFNAAQIANPTDVEVQEITEEKYYLVGSWGENNAGWDTENPQVEMTNNNGVYSVTYNIAAGTEFKVIKKFEDELTWYGGNNNPQEITKNGEIQLSSPGENFKINTEGEYTFSVNTTGTALTLTVTGFPAQQFFLAGNWENGWSADGMIQFEAGETEGEYTLTQELEANAEFKVVSEGKWYRSENPALTKENNNVALNTYDDEVNMTLPSAGTYTFKLQDTPNGLFLTITDWPAQQFFLAGNWENGWTADGMIQFETGEAEGVYTLTQELEANAEIKVVSEGKWYRSENPALSEENNNVALNTYDDEVNMTLPSAGTYTFTLQDTPNGLFLTVSGFPVPVVKYALVTDVTKLEAGKKILLVGENASAYYAMGAQQTNNRAGVAVERNKGIIIPVEGVEAITLESVPSTTEAADAFWAFKVADGYLYASSKSSNQLKTRTSIEDDAKASIDIAYDGQATISFQREGRNDLRFNYNNDFPLFACYASTSNLPHVYIYMETELDEIIPTVTIGAAEWATYVAVDNVEFPEEVTAYVPVEVNEGQTAVMIESVSAVKKGEPVILNGEAGTYDLSIAETEPAEVENIFKVSDGTDVSDGTYYMLSYKNEKVGFRKVQDGVTIPAGKPYIEIVNAAKEFIPFGGGEATGIESFETVGFDVNAPIYDMQGRQVQKLQKGIFIQNGKKLIVK